MNQTNHIIAPAETIPDYARVALVPIANPETAADLLHVAAALAHPSEGKVIALVVSLGDVESQAQSVEQLEPIIQEIREEGTTIELKAETATSVSRGILDAIRQTGADLVILGLKQHRRGQVEMGTVVESVLKTATCDVLIYRRGTHEVRFDKVIVPIDTDTQSKVAARMGIRLAARYKTPIEVIHTQASHRSQFEGLAIIEQTIADLPGHQFVKRSVVNGVDPAASILARVQEDDLLIVGFNKRSDFERHIFGDVAWGVLEKAPSTVIMVSRAVGKETTLNRNLRRFFNWLHPVLTQVEQDDIIEMSRRNASFTIDYLMLILVSAALATLGLLLNSVAVIIGAMLVAPLMSPLVAMSVTLTVGRIWIAQRAFTSLVIGVLMAVLMAFVLGLLLPIPLPTSEMLARGAPTLLDAAVAFASGVVGAYATARKDIPAALAGVAIAAALMPPICTIGLGLAFGEINLAFGATLLFLTNIISIIGAGILVFVWLGMRLKRYDVWRQIAAIILLILVAIPVAIELFILTQQNNTQNIIRRELSDGLSPEAELVSVEFIQQNPVRVIATIRTEGDISQEKVNTLQDQIASELGEAVQLELVVMQVIRLRVDPEKPEFTPEPEVTDTPAP
ncbi:MAG: hypothetical protein CUN56_07065 [Phototrophicales bacterium]|nr:MAG: hypothetical protein CUN56_07065 [Phototrophicales bacterium]